MKPCLLIIDLQNDFLASLATSAVNPWSRTRTTSSVPSAQTLDPSSGYDRNSAPT